MDSEHQTHCDDRDEDETGSGAFDPTVGPGSPAAHDVSLSTSPAASAGVIAAREEITAREQREEIAAREQREQTTPPTGRGSNPDHPQDDPHAAEVSDRRDVD